jgi:hypothetical protein
MGFREHGAQCPALSVSMRYGARAAIQQNGFRLAARTENRQVSEGANMRGVKSADDHEEISNGRDRNGPAWSDFE